MSNFSPLHFRLSAASRKPSRPLWRSNRIRTALCLTFVGVLLLSGALATRAEQIPESQTLPSLQSYSGLLMMPNARILPDWRIRFGYGNFPPYRYYGGALGVFDRFELFGQFTEVMSVVAFKGQGYGNYKDRAAGAKLVLLTEGEFLPQLAIGAFDATGTAIFGHRYIVASKMLGDFDLTFGLGQGTLGGEYVGGQTDAENGLAENAGQTFLTSSPFRQTRAFGGVEWHATDDLILVAEYDSQDYSNMFGFEDIGGGSLVEHRQDNRVVPINAGLKYKLNNNVLLQGAVMGGNTIAFGGSAAFDMEPEGMLVWKKYPEYIADERLRWRAYEASNKELAALVGEEIKSEGFDGIGVAVSDDALWVEAQNNVSLSPVRALGRISAVASKLTPERIQTFYLNLKADGQILQSLKCNRKNLEYYANSRLDEAGFFQVSELDLYGSSHWDEFSALAGATEVEDVPDKRWGLRIRPKMRTFVNNREGFFKNKALILTTLDIYPWDLASIIATYELTIFNEFNEVSYPPLEKHPTRTDIVEYEERSGPVISELALDQVALLPHDVLGRAAVGFFERGYAGFGAEIFRFFKDGRVGAGLESEIVWKRGIDNPYEIKTDEDPFYTGYVNLWANIWPKEGIEASLKIGRFLAGDRGASLLVQRVHNYYTVGGWYTYTDTDVFTSAKNRGQSEAGVFISIPLSIFADSDIRGHISYAVTSFTVDQGATVDQPNSLVPRNSSDTPIFMREHFGDLRRQ